MHKHVWYHNLYRFVHFGRDLPIFVLGNEEVIALTQTQYK